MVGRKRQKVTCSVPVCSPHHTTHISVDGIVRSQEKSHESAPFTPLERCAMLSPPRLQPFHSRDFGDFSCFTCCRGIGRKEEAKSATTPTHHCSSIVSPYQLLPASPQHKYVTNDLNHTTATVHTTVFHTSFSYLSGIYKRWILWQFQWSSSWLFRDISIVLILQHNYHRHSSTMQHDHLTDKEKWNV
jgi:hypothetical protein